MFEVFYISTGDVHYLADTYEQALSQVLRLTNCNDYDIRKAEDSETSTDDWNINARTYV